MDTYSARSNTDDEAKDSNMANLAAKVDPIGGKHFEDHIDAKIDTKCMAKNFLETKVDTSAAYKTLGPRKTQQLWRFVLANNTHALVTKYHRLQKEYKELHYLGKMDAVLVNLKKT